MIKNEVIQYKGGGEKAKYMEKIKNSPKRIQYFLLSGFRIKGEQVKNQRKKSEEKTESDQKSTQHSRP